MTVNWKEHAEKLLEEFNLCIGAKPKHNAINIQLEKDSVAKWAYHLNYTLAWGTEHELAEACNQFEPKLEHLKSKLIIEILTNGSV